MLALDPYAQASGCGWTPGGLGEQAAARRSASGIAVFLTSGTFDIDGYQFHYGRHDKQGSDAVFLTVIGRDGEYGRDHKLGNGNQ